MCSAAAPAGAQRRDGISYLLQQKRRGLVTPLLPPREEAVLWRTGARDLASAWEQEPSGNRSADLVGEPVASGLTGYTERDGQPVGGHP